MQIGYGNGGPKAKPNAATTELVDCRGLPAPLDQQESAPGGGSSPDSGKGRRCFCGPAATLM